MTKNVTAKLLSTKKLLTQNPRPPLTNRNDEFRLTIIGRSFSGKSVSTVEMLLWLIVHPTETPAKTNATTNSG